MKIVLTADVHLGNNSDDESPEVQPEPMDLVEHKKFAKQMHDEKPDVLIVAGDCAETHFWPTLLEQFFRIYKNPHGISVVIPGNHDVWLGRPYRQTHEEALDNFFTEALWYGWFGLRNTSVEAATGIWIAGAMGWYDFSTRDQAVQFDSPEIFDQFVFDNKKWTDYRMMRMHSALEVNGRRMKEFKDSLAQVPPPDQRKALIVVSHFPGFSRLLTPNSSPDFGAAFMGNLEIGKLTIEAEADYYFCGHTHRRKEFQLGKTKCINNGSGYGRGAHRYDVIEI